MNLTGIRRPAPRGYMLLSARNTEYDSTDMWICCAVPCYTTRSRVRCRGQRMTAKLPVKSALKFHHNLSNLASTPVCAERLLVDLGLTADC